MKREQANRFRQVIGGSILISTVFAWRFAVSPRALFRSPNSLTLINVLSMFPLWCFCLCGSIGLLRGRAFGFYCMVVAFLLSIVGSIFSFIPFLPRLFWGSPNMLYYFWATNLVVIVLLGACEYVTRWRKA